MPTTASMNDKTPLNYAGATPLTTSGINYGATPSSTASVSALQSIQADLDERNRPWTDAELDILLPSEGYEILQPPADYVPIQTPARKLTSTPAPMQATGYQLPTAQEFADSDLPPTALESGLPGFRNPDDAKFFGKLLEDVNESRL